MIKIIAEAGVNHNGDKALAFRLIEKAHEAGADIVKFQTFKSEQLVTKMARQADYQSRNTGSSESQLDMLQRLELDFETHKELIAYSHELGIDFLSTAFDMESLGFLVRDLSLRTLKIPSGELTNAPFLLAHAVTGCDLIVSTGMSSLAEIEMALGVIAFGLICPQDAAPTEEKFLKAYACKDGQLALRNKVTLLHCTSEYPAPLEEINLKAMRTLASAFGLSVGYSDHSQGTSIPIAAAALGAILIEKHFTLDRRMAGPDHRASLEPEELKNMVSAIREVELAMGTGLKAPQPSEVKNKTVARKSLVAACAIKSGEVFSAQNVDIKRPGDGLTPYRYWTLLGKVARQDYREGELLHE